jgi:hypothetical protein
VGRFALGIGEFLAFAHALRRGQTKVCVLGHGRHGKPGEAEAKNGRPA